MLSRNMLELLKQLKRKPLTKRGQSAFKSHDRLCEAVARMVINGVVRVDRNGKENVISITERGMEVLHLCEQLEKCGVIFE